MSITIPETSFRYISQKERFKIWLLSTWQRLGDSWRIYAHNKLAVLGLLLLLVYLLMAVAHPVLMRTVWPKGVYDPVVGHDVNIFPHPSPPTSGHLLGTDTLGRDVLSILMAATAPSLQMAMTAALTAAAIGTLVGAVSAYFRGALDSLFSHLADLSLLAPAPIVMVVIGFTLDIDPWKFGLLYGIMVGVGGVAIVLRAHALTIMSKAFIDAARMVGGGPFHIIFRHLIPHMLPLAAVNMLLTVTGAIFASGFIAFLGLSRAQLNWGSMIYDTFTYQQINGTVAWNVLVPSAMAISLFAASFYLIALGLHDVAEPRAAEQLALTRRARSRKRGVLRPFGKPTRRVGEAPATGAPVPALATAAAASSRVGTVAPAPAAAAPVVQMRAMETCQVAVLVAALHRETAQSEDGSAGGGGMATLDPIAEIGASLARNGGLVERLNDGSLVASFGLCDHAPPQASALLAVRAGLDLKKLVERFNHQLTGEGLGMVKLSVGISTGEVTLRAVDRSNWAAPVLSTDPGLLARTLGSFASFMRHGGVLICESTFNYLAAVKHHFAFGRQGIAKLPVGDGQGMVYELSSSNSILD